MFFARQPPTGIAKDSHTFGSQTHMASLYATFSAGGLAELRAAPR